MFGEIKQVLVYPDEFFKGLKVRKVRAVGHLLLISVVLLAVQLALLTAGLVPANFWGMYYMFQGGIEHVAIPLLSFIAMVVSIFLYAGLLQAFARTGYWKTFTGLAYGSTPLILFSWLPVLNLLFGLWGWYLQVKGVSMLTGMDMKRTFYVTIPALVILGVMFFFVNFFIGEFFA